MATKEIKNRIVLEGEKEYNAALKEANRNLKTLKSELKAETAELGRNATEQQKNETRVKNLRKQIAEQEKVVKTYEKALEEVRQKYGDNEDAIASWEQKLNNARATLGNMKNDLDGLGDGLAEVEKSSELAVVATASIADAMGKIGDAGSAVADTIEGIFGKMIDTVSDAVSNLWGMIADTAAKANNWTDLGAIWNTDPANIERYARGVEWAGKSFSDLQNAVSKIAMGDADKIFDLTGVSHVGDVDEWKYAMDVLSSISSMDYQHRLDALGEIFGEKRAAGVMDIVNAWSTIEEGADKLTEGGYGLGAEGLNTMNEIQEKINGLDASWSALKDHIADGLGEAVLPLMINVQGGLDGIAEFLSAEDEEGREAALEKIRTNAEEFFRRVGEALQEAVKVLAEVGAELEGSDDPVVSAIGGILSGLTKSLQWMIDNQDAVKGAFEAIFGFWLVAKLAAVGGKLSAILLQMQAIQAFKGLGGGGGNGGAPVTGTGTGGGSGGGWLGNLLGSTGAKVAGGTLAGLAVLFENALKPQGNDDILTKEEEAAYEQEHADEITWQRNKFAWNKAVTEAGFNPDDMEPVTQATDAQRQAAEAFWDAFRENPMDFSDEEWDAFEEAFAGNEELFDKISELMDQLAQQTDDDSWRGMEDLPGWLWTMDPSLWNNTGNSGSDGITSSDLQGFRGLPAQLQRAAQAGTAAGVSGIRVYMDSVAVGHLVAPTVSQDIAAAI